MQINVKPADMPKLNYHTIKIKTRLTIKITLKKFPVFMDFTAKMIF